MKSTGQPFRTRHAARRLAGRPEGFELDHICGPQKVLLLIIAAGVIVLIGAFLYLPTVMTVAPVSGLSQ